MFLTRQVRLRILSKIFFIVLLKDHNHLLFFLVCHLIGVASTCINPILYGFLNDNIATELAKLNPGKYLSTYMCLKCTFEDDIRNCRARIVSSVTVYVTSSKKQESRGETQWKCFGNIKDSWKFKLCKSLFQIKCPTNIPTPSDNSRMMCLTPIPNSS